MRLRIVLGLFSVALLIFLVGPDGYGQGKGGKPGLPIRMQLPTLLHPAAAAKGFRPQQDLRFHRQGQAAIVIDEMSVGLKARWPISPRPRASPTARSRVSSGQIMWTTRRPGRPPACPRSEDRDARCRTWSASRGRLAGIDAAVGRYGLQAT